MEDAPFFRASKKRKFARPKESNNNEVDLSQHENTNEVDTSMNTDQVSLSELLKLRKQNKLRGGVQFTNAMHMRDSSDTANALTLAKIDQEDQGLQDISSRFTATTGQVVDIDRHMMAYIDSEIAKRQTVPNNTRQSQQAQNSSETDEDQCTDTDDNEEDNENVNKQQVNTNVNPSSTSTSRTNHLPKIYQPQNALSEFDLGPSAHTINLARTNEAIQRARTGLPPIAAEEPQQRKPRRPRKPRLGRDGKPLRPRPRKRRNSDDIARDALVEQVLREHRPEAATITNSANTKSAHNNNNTTTNNPQPDNTNNNNPNEPPTEPTDDILASQFRREFMDAMAERRSRHQAQSQSKKQSKAKANAAAGGSGSKSGASEVNNVLHGPKLGGSRSARAKMHASLQAMQEGKDKKK